VDDASAHEGDGEAAAAAAAEDMEATAHEEDGEAAAAAAAAATDALQPADVHNANDSNFAVLCREAGIESAYALLVQFDAPLEMCLALKGVKMNTMSDYAQQTLVGIIVDSYYKGVAPPLAQFTKDVMEVGACDYFARMQAEDLAEVIKMSAGNCERAARARAKLALGAGQTASTPSPLPPPSRTTRALVLPPVADATPVGTPSRPSRSQGPLAEVKDDEDVQVVSGGGPGVPLPERFKMTVGTYKEGLEYQLADDQVDEDLIQRFHKACKIWKGVPAPSQEYMPRQIDNMGVVFDSDGARVVCMHHRLMPGPQYKSGKKADAQPYHFCWKEQGSKENPTKHPEGCIGIGQCQWRVHAQTPYTEPHLPRHTLSVSHSLALCHAVHLQEPAHRVRAEQKPVQPGGGGARSCRRWCQLFCHCQAGYH
jgi:hypothetical protein